MYFKDGAGKEWSLSTSSLIWPTYTIRATIFEKVFQPEKFPKNEYNLVSIYKMDISLDFIAALASSGLQAGQ